MMLLALLVAAPSILAASPAQPAHVPQQGHIRTWRPQAAELLTLARNRSAIASHLLESVEQADVIVYLELVRDPQVPRARTTLAGSEAGRRMLLMSIDAEKSLNEQIALLAHELQHVLEIAHAPGVTTPSGLRELYQRIGSDALARDRFETAAADRIGREVFAELTSGTCACAADTAAAFARIVPLLQPLRTRPMRLHPLPAEPLGLRPLRPRPARPRTLSD